MKTIKERAEAIANDVLRKVNKKAEEEGGFVAPQQHQKETIKNNNHEKRRFSKESKLQEVVGELLQRIRLL